MWSMQCAVFLLAVVHFAYAVPDLSHGHFSRRAALPMRLSRRQSLATRGNLTGITAMSFSDDKQSYYSVIQVGGISFRVALDTASSDLWIVSTDCSSASCKASPRYPREYWTGSFSPVNNNGTSFGVSFADGTVATGFVGREKVGISNLTVANQAFGVVQNSNVTVDDQVSGILGLGFPRLSTMSSSVANATPFFSTLAQQGVLGYPLFGLSVTRTALGSLSLGGIDSSIVQNTSNVGWNEVMPFRPFGAESNTSSYLQWAIPLAAVAINGTSVTTQPTYPNANANSSIALLDIGTSGIYGPYQDVTRIFSLLAGSRLVDVSSGQWAVPCDISETMSFTIGTQNITLQPSDFLIGPTAGNPDLCLTWPRALDPSSDGIDWQLGTAFLRTVYSIFSYGINGKEPPMIGLYPLHNTTEPVESTDDLSSFFASASATVATTLPNFPLSTPSHTTPPYAFNTSVSASIGQIVASGLATSAYSAAIQAAHVSVSALPTVMPPSNAQTFILTSSGIVLTSTSIIATPSITLGVPGFNAGTALYAPSLPLLLFGSWLTFFLAAARVIL
ncbi:hypothetical protein PLICRDRAFT_40126 [Plicaturopsis crispa FD-325 SS-3]|nr:hypothetical protein PLICRDRAFT_40126 [Plicaturopsis crispa FD-325 SS-3]